MKVSRRIKGEKIATWRTEEVNGEDAQGVEGVEGEVGTERERVIIYKASEDGEDLMAVERKALSEDNR